MTDFLKLAAEIASQLDGTLCASGYKIGSAPAGDDIAWIDLANERAGLRVVLRKGMFAEATRVRASMSLQGMKEAAPVAFDFREVPAVHTLETAAAMSRGARVIAAQIETKIIQPAIPMRDAFALAIEARVNDNERQAQAINAFRHVQTKVIPGVSSRFEATGEFYIGLPGANYLRGHINSDGGMYIERASSIPLAKALRILAILTEA